MDNILSVILNWNEIECTKRCIKSLLSQKYAAFILKILVIDNNSEDNPFKELSNEFPDIEIIISKKNLGVAGGRNVGIAYAIKRNFDFILFIDNDACADPMMVEYLWKSAKIDVNAGIFGPKIYIANKEKIIWRAGCTSWKWTYLHSGFRIAKTFSNLLGKRLPKYLDTERGEGHFDDGQYDEEQNIAFQIGCAQFVRADVFSDVGILDNRFSPYGSEDIDFCNRTLKRGWKIKYVPKAICWHRTESSIKNNYQRCFNNTKNIVILARKSLSPFYFYFLFMPDFVFFTIPLIIIKYCFTLNLDALNGFLMALKWSLTDIKEKGLFLS